MEWFGPDAKDEGRVPTAQLLGHVIRTRRLERGLTQEELAARIGDRVTQSDVSRLERGGVVLPRAHRLSAIATALGIPIGELLVEAGWLGVSPDDPSGAELGPVVVPQPLLIEDRSAQRTTTDWLTRIHEDLVLVAERLKRIEDRLDLITAGGRTVVGEAAAEGHGGEG